MVHTTMPLFRDNHKNFISVCFVSSFNLAKDIFLAKSMLKDVFFLLIQHNTTCILTQKHKIMSMCLINLQGQISETNPQSFTGSLREFRDGDKETKFCRIC
jgi:hypothetical protein